jgi:hypothetical protein
MALETGQLIVERLGRLKGHRGTFESTWQDISDNVLGLRHFNETHEPGRQRMRRIYDTTSLLAGHLLAGSFHGLLTNPAGKWHRMTVEPKQMRAIPAVHEWLVLADATTDSMLKTPRFGFPTASSEFYIDYVFFGTGVSYIEDLPGRGLRYHSRPLGEIIVDESSSGQVDTVFRVYKISHRKFIQEFGEDADEEVTRQMDKNPTGEIEMIHLTHPRSELRGGPEARDARPWRSAHVIKRNSKIVSRSGYWTNPWQVARFGTEAGELYGRGPAWMALSDQKMLNEMGKILIKQSQKLMAPPLLVPDDGVLTQVDTSPDSLNVYRAGVFKDDPIRTLPVSDKTLISEKLVAQRQQKVEQAFFSHLLQLFDSTPMTATQTLEMESKAARILVSTIARAASEYAEPTLRRTLDIAERGGMLPPRPEEMDGLEVKIEYLSPVMRAQKQSESRAILNTWASAGQLAQFQPDVFDNFDPDASIRLVAEAEGVPPEILRALDERDGLRELRAQQQQAQEMAMAEAAGKVLPGAASLIEASKPSNEIPAA